MDFAKRLKELRAEKGIYQKDLAEILHVAPSAVSAWEIGRNEPCNEMLIKISDFFGVTLDYLLGKTDY